MSSYDDIVRMMREADRILAPLRDFERLYEYGLQQVAANFLERERLFRAALPELSSSYHSAIESLQPALDQLRKFGRHSPAMGLLADAHNSLSGLLSRQADLENIARATIALSPHGQEKIAAYQRLGQDVASAELTLSHCRVGVSCTMWREKSRAIEELKSETTQLSGLNLREFNRRIPD